MPDLLDLMEERGLSHSRKSNSFQYLRRQFHKRPCLEQQSWTCCSHGEVYAWVIDWKINLAHRPSWGEVKLNFSNLTWAWACVPWSKYDARRAERILDTLPFIIMIIIICGLWCLHHFTAENLRRQFRCGKIDGNKWRYCRVIKVFTFRGWVLVLD